MASNKLMEAAAEILANSKKSASAMPPQKLGGEVQDLGGPTPQNAKPDDDSHKIHASAKAPDNSAKNKSTITTKPSDASPDTQNKAGKTMKEEEEVADDEVIAEEETLDETSHKEEMKKKNRNVYKCHRFLSIQLSGLCEKQWIIMLALIRFYLVIML